MEPLQYPDSGDACAVDPNSITGLNCAGFGSSMVVTATFGMVAAGQVLRKLAAAAMADAEAADTQAAVAAVQAGQAEAALLS